jgi:hypothetical protein
VVTQLYQQYLGRNPDPGWQGYLDALANGSQTVALVTAEISGSQEANAYAAAQARSKGAAPNTTPSPPYVFAPGAVGVTPTGQPIYPPGYVPPAAPTPSPPPTPPTATPTPPAPIPTAAPAPAPHLLPRSLFSGGDGPDFGSYCAFYPEDPYCALANDLGPFFSGIPNSPQIINNTVVVGSGLLAADVHAIVNDALSGLWGVVVGTLDLVLGGIVSQVQKAITDLGNAVKAAWNILSRMAGLILRFLGTMWNWTIAGLVRAVHQIVDLLDNLYKDILVPMAQTLAHIRQIILDLWKRFVVPLLIVLQDIRRVLNILAAFHIKWAAKLDAQLANLEARITQPLLYLLGFVNSVANWINLLVTVNYLLQKSIFLNSLKAYVGESLNLQLGAMTKSVSSADIAAAQHAAAVPSAQQSQDDLLQYLTSQSGPTADVIAQQLAQLDRQLSVGA